LLLIALLGAACAQPAQVEPPKPPPPLVVVPASPPETLSLEGRSRPTGPGKQSVDIFVNGHRVGGGTLTTLQPRGSFRGNYEGHDVLADCTLTDKVRCSIAIDGAREMPEVEPAR
jgi:hypothetical protein